MRRPALLLLGLAAVISNSAGADIVTVTILQRAPIEMISPTGEITGVTESTAGTKMTLVSVTGPQLILQDANGARYEVAASATDYTPPAAPPSTAPAPPTSVAVKPVPAARAVPAAKAPPVAAGGAADFGPTPDAQLAGVAVGTRAENNLMAVWPQGGIAGRPLLIAAHGHGGSGPGEIRGWLELARSHRFTIVCPTFESAVNTSFLPDDEPYFADCLRWIETNLQYDKANVFMTGFSGGGFATWYLATKRPDFFRGLFFQSCNFAGNYYGLDLGHWFDRPMKLIWGSADMPNIAPQNQNAIDALKAADCKSYTTEILAGGHHQEHQDMVVDWMEKSLAQPSDTPP